MAVAFLFSAPKILKANQPMFDLHTHSNASDGTDSPGELISKAHAAGLSGIALTDHDTLQGWKEAVEYLRPGM